MDLYLLQQPTDKVFSGNPVRYKFALYPYDDTNSTDIRLLVTVYAEIANFSGHFNQVKQIPLLPQADGTFQVNIQTIVDAYLTFFFPRLSLNLPAAAIGQFLNFYITYQLLVNGTGSTPVSLDAFTAYKGGISYEEFNADLFFANASLFTGPTGLTYVTKKDVCPEEYLFLNFINPNSSPSQFKTVVTALLDDGSTATYTSSLYSPTPVQYALYVMPVGFTQLGIAALATGNTVVNYSVSIKNADNDVLAVSPLYVIDYRQYYFKKYLLWVNSLGAVESLCLKGKTDLSADYTYTAVTKSSINDYFSNAMLQAKETNEQPQETMRYNGYTTWIDKDYLDTLRDLFLSKKIYELQSGKLVPVKIDNSTNSTLTLYSTTDQKYYLNITWLAAYLNEYYTKRNTFTLPDACPAVLLFNVVQLSRSALLIIYRLNTGYNKLKITVTVGTGDPQDYYFDGQDGIVTQVIEPITDDSVGITVIGYTVCNSFSDPEELGTGSTVELEAFGNKPPVAVDDYYTIYAGFTDFVALGNILDNDYDPDGDAITPTAVTNVATTAGGHITIGSDGATSYKPPSSSFSGTDSYTYTITDAFSATATGVIHIGVGESPDANMVYVQKAISGVVAGPPTSGVVTFKFFTSSAATTTKNTTGTGITIHYDQTDVVSGVSTTTHKTVTATGTQVTVYTGVFSNPATGEAHSITLTSGTGYTII